ncbi:GNAT family N-acetyltransferase [Streptomyces tsukubensis]|uniref:GNAT family N-acetyltransferase n=1 Tax=Streptomyces tsukubensis TaxID=83656 RepID=UPI0036AA86A9
MSGNHFSNPAVTGVYALLADGTTVRVRPLVPADRAAVARLYGQMSPLNLRRRFFAAGPLIASQAADALCASPAGPGVRALVAEADGEPVGVAEYHTEPGGTPGTAPADAEVGLAVADEWHHRGTGTLLLEHLADLARADGLREPTADALSENLPALRVFRDLGLPLRRSFEGPEVRLRVALTPDEHYLTALDTRGRTAGVAGLLPLLRPRSVVVVGAGHRPGSMGRAILRNLRGHGFTGPVHTVNLHGPAIDGLPCHPTVSAASVPAVAEECGAFGIRALAVLASGLDARQAADLRAACRGHGMRLVGPNWLGLADTETDVRLDATVAARFPLRVPPGSPPSRAGSASPCCRAATAAVPSTSGPWRAC